MLKGKTKIILTNVETGEQEVHEDENLVTNALDKIINIEMAMNHVPNTRILPLATNALGGIMLFDGELTEDPDNIHFPVEAHLVGYANQAVNTTDVYRGSYNSIESGKTADGYVSVWDFGTTQANGTIKAVARTHNHAGQCPIFYSHGPDYYTTNNGTPTTDRDWMPIRYDGEYVYMLKGNSSSHQMRLARVKIAMLGMGVADYSDVPRSYELVASWDTEVTTYSWTYYGQPRETTVYADDPFCYEDGQDGKIYCMFYGAYQDGEYHKASYDYDITFFTINYGDGNFEKSETTRLRSGTNYWTDKRFNDLYCAYRYRGHVHNGVLYRISSNRKLIYKIPLDNPGAYSAVRICSDDVGDYIGDIGYTGFHNGCIYFEVYHYTDTSYEILGGILYPDSVFILLNFSYGGRNWDHGNNYCYIYSRTCDDDLTVWGTYSGDAFTRNWAANYLGTINNLGTTITKTAAQTMKIIYTLTDITEEDEQDGGE